MNRVSSRQASASRRACLARMIDLTIQRLRLATTEVEAAAKQFVGLVNDHTAEVADPERSYSPETGDKLSREMVETPLNLLISAAGLLIPVATDGEADKLKELLSKEDLTTSELAQGLCKLVESTADKIDLLAQRGPVVH